MKPNLVVASDELVYLPFHRGVDAADDIETQIEVRTALDKAE